MAYLPRKLMYVMFIILFMDVCYVSELFSLHMFSRFSAHNVLISWNQIGIASGVSVSRVEGKGEG
jgi:hypothetical protein